jgi:hypothetical protein
MKIFSNKQQDCAVFGSTAQKEVKEVAIVGADKPNITKPIKCVRTNILSLFKAIFMRSVVGESKWQM